MDLRCWKRVLTQWVFRCNFVGRNFTHLEQSDIQGFFNIYIQRLPLPVSPAINNIVDFLKAFYPHFALKFDSAGVFTTTDYIYVYSLLLHYSCVQSPSEFFHNICKELPDFSQQCIATFFCQLLDREVLSRDVLRQIIVNISSVALNNTKSVNKGITETINDSIDETRSTSFNTEKNDFSSFASPSSSKISHTVSMTPLSQLNAYNVSPITPKTELLENRTKELYNLKASLETERYEKSLLEGKIVQLEITINELEEKLKLNKEENAKLKLDMFLASDEEQGTAMQEKNNADNFLEKMVKRYEKEADEKEKYIAQLNEKIQQLCNEKSSFQQKIEYADKQIYVCMEQIKELEMKVEEQKFEIKQKTEALEYLTNNKIELEKCINETRMASQNLYDTDILDTSFSTNSSNNSPENLGFSVIDVQLREKEKENERLRNEVEKMLNSKKEIMKQLNNISNELSSKYKFKLIDGNCEESCILTPNNESDMVRFIMKVEELDKQYSEEKKIAIELKKKIITLTESNTSLDEKVNKLNETLLMKSEEIEELRNENKQLKLSNQELEKIVSGSKQTLLGLNNDKNELNIKISALNSDLLKSHQAYMEQDREFNKKITVLNNELQSKRDIQMHLCNEQIQREKLEKLQLKYEGIKRYAKESDEHLGAMQSEISKKEKEMEELGKEILKVRNNNRDLEDRINLLMVEHTKEMEAVQTQLNGKQLIIAQLEKQCNEYLNEKNQIILKCVCKSQKDSRDILFDLLKETNWNECLKHIDALKRFKEDAANNFIEFNKTIEAKNIQIEELQRSLKSADDLHKTLVISSELQLRDAKKQIEWSNQRIIEAEEKLETTKQKHSSFIEQIKRNLQNKEFEVKKQIVVQADQCNQKIVHLKEELSDEHEKCEYVHHELDTLICMYTKTKQELSTALQTLEIMRRKYDNAIEYFDNCIECFFDKINCIANSNKYLIQEMFSVKIEQEINNKCVVNTDSENQFAFNEALQSNSEMTGYLNVYENRLIEAGACINALLKSNKIVIEHLIENNKRNNEKSRQIETIHKCHLNKYDEYVKELKVELENLTLKYDNLTLECKNLTTQLEEQKNDQDRLLKNLRKTNDNLNVTLHNRELEIIDLTTLISTKKEEIQTLKIELQHERNKLSNLMQKLTATIEELQANDLTTLEVLDVLNKHVPDYAVGDGDNKHIDNIFNVVENCNSNFNRMRHKLNILMHTTNQLHTRIETTEDSYRDAINRIEILSNQNRKLEVASSLHKESLNNLKKKMEDESISSNKKLTNQVKHLNETIKSLEDCNEKLSLENVKLQTLAANYEKSTLELNKKIENILSDLTTLQRNNTSYEIQLKIYNENEEQLKRNDKNQSEKLNLLQATNLNLQTCYDECAVQLKQITEKFNSTEELLKSSQEQQRQLKNELGALKDQLIKKNESFFKFNSNIKLKNITLDEIIEEKEKLKHSVDRLTITNDKLLNKFDELNAQNKRLHEVFNNIKNAYEAVCHEKLVVTTKCDSAKKQIANLSQENKELCSSKKELTTELKLISSDLHLSQENIAKLIHQIESVHSEKEMVNNQCSTLRVQLTEFEKKEAASNLILCNTKEQTQNLESQLMSSNNEIKYLKTQVNKYQKEFDELINENKVLWEKYDQSMKRLEKMAFSLNEIQGFLMKSHREKLKQDAAMELNTKREVNLKKDKEILQKEISSLWDNLHKAQQNEELIKNKITTTVNVNKLLTSKCDELETKLLESLSRLSKFDKLRENYEFKLRDLQNDMKRTDQSNINMTHEIGALNAKIEQQRIELAEKIVKISGLDNKLKMSCKDLCKYQSELKLKKDEIKQFKESLNQYYEKFMKEQTKNSELNQQLSTLLIQNEDLNLLHVAKQNEFTKMQLEIESKHSKIEKLEQEVINLAEKNYTLQGDIQRNEQKYYDMLESVKKSSKSNVDEIVLINLRKRLNETESIAEQLREDNKVLQAKYQDAKERIAAEIQQSETRIKEQRLEMEGKLEKMKTKMKMLYTDEIKKMKTKLEREALIAKTDIDALKAQNEKFEEHTRKLSNQIVRLNDNLLEQQKLNAVLSTKLKHNEEQKKQKQLKCTGKTYISTFATSVPPAVNLGTNLAMEDEEGELFNNTYLADLKNGRMSEITAEELQYRNSLLPPHLKSAYAVQYDLGKAPEDEIKDGSHMLDDSTSALLNTTRDFSSTRKKQSGTHYKRPGPPTPSKNGGRLSLGGSSEVPREILKDTCNSCNSTSVSGSGVTSYSKTPSRFNLFSSRVSFGDENMPPKRRLSNIFKRK